MKFNFAWISEDQEPSPEDLKRCEERIFHLRIWEEEGCLPQAQITIPRPLSGVLVGGGKRFGFISVMTVDGKAIPLFKGSVVNCPVEIDGETIRLHFMAQGPERDQNLKKLLRQLHQDPVWDPLFVSEDKRQDADLVDLLEAKASHLYWDRVSDEVHLNDLLVGKSVISLKGNYYYDSLKLKLVHSPLEAIDMCVTANWVQRYQGSHTLDPVLRGHLKEGVLASYSGEHLEERWWKADQRMGLSGYRIKEASLERMRDTHGRLPIWVAPQDPLVKSAGRMKGLVGGTKPHKVHFKRSVFRPSLGVIWRYVQPRREKVLFTLRHEVQDLAFPPRTKKSLHFHLMRVAEGEECAYWASEIYYTKGESIEANNAIYEAKRSHRGSQSFEEDLKKGEWELVSEKKNYALQQSRGTYFTTDRGKQSLERALEIAKAYLAASSRCIEISFCCSLGQALEWTCRDSLSLEDPRLPGGKAMGKIKSLTFEAMGETGTQRAYVTIACCIGKGPLKPISQHGTEESYTVESVLEGSYALQGNSLKTHSGLVYKEYRTQVPERGHLYPEFLGASDILREVTVVNDADFQKEKLQNLQYPVSHNILRDLEEHKTRLNLRLEDLRTTRLLEHIITLEIPQAWSGPQHIKLS
jgi:hypothetical protein